MNLFVFRPATSEDWPSVARLLSMHDLPLEAAQAHLSTFVLAFDAAGHLAGVAGLECYGDAALLRSVAVDPACQGQGLGRQITEAALYLARQQDVQRLYLLTTTAPDFFARLGFERIDRADVEAPVRQSVEFTTLCPASAVVMRRTLEPDGEVSPPTLP